MDKIYFANLQDPEELGKSLVEKFSNYQDEIFRTGRLELWRKCHRYYFALDSQGRHEATEIGTAGEQNELSFLKANHYRNLLQHLIVLITQQRPAWECRAVNTDYKSQVQTILGRNVLDFYMREKRLAPLFRKAAERAVVYAEAYVEMEWDNKLGEPVRPAVDEMTGEVMGNDMIKTGDVRFHLYEPINVARSIRDDNQSWKILKRWVNRYELLANFPEFETEVLSASEYQSDDKFYYYSYPAQSAEDDDDIIPVYTFYHQRTDAVPDGRIVRFLGDGTVLHSTTLEMEELEQMPVFNMIPHDQHGIQFGYSVSFDLLVVQEAIDLLYSTILSNQVTFGVQNIWMKPGSSISTLELGGGLNVIESTDKPEPLNLTNTPPEIFNFLQGIEQLGEVLSGVNSVARGQPEASLKSGAALAMVASQAVQFSNGLQSSWVQFLEDTGTGLIKMLQKKAAEPRIAVIAGKDNRSQVKEFTGSDLADINRVIVDIGSPMAQTISGRIQMADNLLERGLIKRPEEYIQVAETGRLDPIIDDDRSEQLLIDAENEALRTGQQVPVVAIDQHVQHITGHRKVLANPNDRSDPQITQTALEHINQHIQALRSVDPALLNVLGMAPIQVLPPGQAPQPEGEHAPQPNAEQARQTGPGEQVQAPPAMDPEQAANMPRMPAGAPEVPQ